MSGCNSHHCQLDSFSHSQVEALLSKTGGAMPGASASVKQHEAFLEETKALLHPGNFQVR